jgi:site-specific DNA recombinase
VSRRCRGNRTNGTDCNSAVLYARVSSKEQETGGYSIPAQQKLLREYAASKGFEIAREFTDVETAKQAGRQAFGEMLAFLNQSTCRIVLVEKTDRLLRNLKDYATLDELDLEIHLVKENVILSKDSRSHEKFIHGIKVLMAKNYVDNLSEEVKKGMTEKAEQGHWPSWAPIGYVNDPETHLIRPDPIEAPLVRQLFENAAQGMTLVRLSETAYQRGLRSRRIKGRITKEGIKRILKNPIYWGPFVWNERVYQGKHQPLVSKQLFDQVQAVLHSKSKPRQNRNHFAFAGLVTCTCGKRLVGQLARGRYRYYACSARCGAAPIKESTLSALFLEHVKAIHVTEEVAQDILRAMKEFETDRQKEHNERLAALHEKQRKIQANIDAAYDDKLNGKIPEDFWLRRTNAWQEEIATVAAEIKTLQDATFDSFEKADALMKLCKKAPDLFQSQTFDEQTRLIRFIESNATFDGKTLKPQYKKPFDELAEGLKGTTGGPDETRTS